MSITLLVIGAVAVILAAFCALLAREVVRNKRRLEQLERRLEQLERRQQAHELSIRHLVKENVEPEEPPPGRPVLHVFRGAAVLAGVLGLVRMHPVRAVLAAAVTAGAVFAVALLPFLGSPAPAVGALGSPPVPARVAPSPVPSVPAGPSPSAASSASPSAAPAVSFSPSSPGRAVVIAVPIGVRRPPPSTVPSSPVPSRSPSPPGSPTPTPTPDPSPSPAQSCLIYLDLVLLNLCVP